MSKQDKTTKQKWFCRDMYEDTPLIGEPCTLTAYYKFVRKAGMKSKTRLDCVCSTRGWKVFEDARSKKEIKECQRYSYTPKGALFFFFIDKPEGHKSHKGGSKNISLKKNNLTAITFLSLTSPFAYGDGRGTKDALVFVIHNLNTVNGEIEEGASIEVFVAAGMSARAEEICKAFAEGLLDEEADALRAEAKEERANYNIFDFLHGPQD